MSLRSQILFWFAALLVLLLFLFLFRDILLPFVLGMVLAYILDPLADRLERLGLSRLLATLAILLIFLLLMAVFVVAIAPILGRQIGGFIDNLPQTVAQLRLLATGVYDRVGGRLIGAQGEGGLEVDKLLAQSAAWLGALLASVWNGGRAIFDVFTVMVITPVVAFYMLLDWDRMMAWLDTYLPRDHRTTVRGLIHEIDRALAGFVRGQGAVCLILGTFYGVALSLVGLNFGLLIGLVAGIISFIPYVGSIVGFVLSIGVALVQFWPEFLPILAVAAIFGAGQFVEGNILQPRLVGSSVGVHPVWLMFALFAFGALFGFVGLLLAVPAAAALGVLVRFGLRQYMASSIYRGRLSDGS